MLQIHDEFSHLKGKVSHQRIAQLRYARDGKCIICGQPAVMPNAKSTFCKKHLAARRMRSRQQQDHTHSAWVPGSRGAIPRELREAYLADRQKRVMALLAEGKSLKQCAAELGVCEATARHIRDRAYVQK